LKDQESCSICGKVIEVKTIDDLQSLNKSLDAHYSLIVDIDAAETKNWNNGKGFIPIGDKENPFSGIFNGNNHNIKNLHIIRENTDNVGLYSNLTGFVHHLLLTNVDIVGNDQVGGLAGECKGIVTECKISGLVIGKNEVGGLVGNSSNSKITECQTYSDVSGNETVGGLIGTNYSKSEISECHTFGETKGIKSIGGLIGKNSDSEIDYCKASGTVIGNKEIGGLVGSNLNTSITQCQASGKINGEYMTGGLIGLNAESKISSCQTTIATTGKINTGGLIGTNLEGSWVEQCQSMGETSGDEYTGGLVGFNMSEKSYITSCKATGKVKGKKMTGGLVGVNTSKGFIYESFATGEVSGIEHSGGLIGVNDANAANSVWDKNSTKQDSSSGRGAKGLNTHDFHDYYKFVDDISGGWDFKYVWEIVGSQKYPMLRCFKNKPIFVNTKKNLPAWTKDCILQTQKVEILLENKDDNWYYLKLKDNTIIQFVFSAPVSSIVETEFGLFILPFDKFPIISSEQWCSGFVRLGEKPVPFQMLRVGDFADQVKENNLTIAFSFCKLPTCGIFLMDTRVENDQFTNEIRRKYANVPPINKPIAEWIVNVHDDYSIQMLKDIIACEQYHIIVARNSSNVNNVFTSNGMIQTIAPMAHHDRIITLDKELRDLLQKEFEDLISYHNSLPSYKVNFNQAMEELGRVFPLDKDPIQKKWE